MQVFFLLYVFRSFDPYHVVTYYIKWVKTSHTYSYILNLSVYITCLAPMNGYPCVERNFKITGDCSDYSFYIPCTK